jgi:type VI secretion system protein ImpK
MAQNDPFGVNDALGTTRIGRRSDAAGMPPPPASPVDPGPIAVPAAGTSPLFAAALPLLTLAPRLRTAEAPLEPGELSQRLTRMLREFEDRALAQGVPRELVEEGAWALAALLDDTILNTPWGGHGRWAAFSLVGNRWRQTDAGDRFFDRLRELDREPRRNLELLRLYHACLALGFEGRYRIQPSLRPTRSDVQLELYDRLRREAGGAPPPELSLRWRGMAAPHRAMRLEMPVWVMAVAALVCLGLVYSGFRLKLASSGSGFDTAIASLPPPAPVRIARATPPAPQPELTGDLVVEDKSPRLILSLGSSALFRAGSANLNPEQIGTVRGLASRLEALPGAIRIIGHTDDVPIKTVRFASNDELARARAASVAEVLAPLLADPSRITIEGRGAREPLAPNDMPANRAKNRRIEIVVEK